MCVLHAIESAPIPGNPMSAVHSVLSLTAFLSTCRLMPLASLMESIHLTFGPPFFLLSPVFPDIIVFPKEH